MDLFVQLRAVVFRHFCAICASLHTVFHLRLCDTYMYVERERERARCISISMRRRLYMV